MDELTLCEHHEAGVSVLVVRGELDLWSGAWLEDRLIQLAAADRVRVVIDLAGLAFCDAAGIRVLLRGHSRARAREGWLRLAGANRRISRVLAIVQLTGVLPVFESVGEAVAGIPGMPSDGGSGTRPGRGLAITGVVRQAGGTPAVLQRRGKP